MAKTLVPIACLALLALAVACQRPGTDRPLNCERYADALVTRSFECGVEEVSGLAITAQSVGDVAKKLAAACEKDKAITATADCVKAIKRAACVDSTLAEADLAACRD